MNSESVRIDISSVVIENLTLSHPDVRQYISRFPESDQVAAVRRAVEVGASVLDRYESTQNLDFLRQQADSILTSVKNSVDAIPSRLQKELLVKMGTDDGQALAPVATLIGQVEKLLKARLQQVESLLNDHIDPRSQESTLGIALASIRLLLDPKHDDSVQKTVEKSLQDVTDENGLLAVAVRKVVENSIEPLEKQLETLAKEVHRQEAVSVALQNTTAKGRPFEEELLPIVNAWASMVGGDVEHVGPDNQPGDIVITLGPSGMSTIAMRIVIEVRDDSTSSGRKRIIDGMSKAIATRHADYGIYVVKSLDGLAQEIGEWSELHSVAGSVIACTAQHLTTVLRFAVAETTIRQLNSSNAQTDVAAIEAELSRMRSILNRIRTINTKSSVIRSASESISDEAEDLKREITSSLAAIEDTLTIQVPE